MSATIAPHSEAVSIGTCAEEIYDYDAAARLIADHLDEADVAAHPQERVSRAEETVGVRFPGSYCNNRQNPSFVCRPVHRASARA
jgi:hypothetical protein